MKLYILSHLFFLYSITPLFSQEALTIKHSCNFATANTEGEVYTYDASKEATDIIDKVMKANVLPQNFIIKAANCANALATTEGKQRYILYSTAFLENFKKEANTQWAAYCVLAHEIGHHLSNHDLEETTPSVRKRFELEADRFAGGVLFNLGATLPQAQAGIHTFSNEAGSNTHPPKQARLEAIAVGWKQAFEQKDKLDVVEPVDMATDEKKMFERAVAEKNAEIAIQILDSLLEINGNFTEAYLERGKREKDKEDIRRNFNAAIEDFNTYIKARPKDPSAYFERGYAYLETSKLKEAIADFDKSIRFNPKNAETYFLRAMAKRASEQFDGALNDFANTLKLKPDYVDVYYQQGLMHKYEFYNPQAALADFDKAFQLDPTHFNALSHKATLLCDIKQYNEALRELDRFEKLFPIEFDEHNRRAECKIFLKQYKEAIADCDKVISKYPKDEIAWLLKSVAKIFLGRKKEVENDILIILHENSRYHGDTYLKLGCRLIDFNLPKDGLEWLEKAVASGYEPYRIESCKREALKKMKN